MKADLSATLERFRADMSGLETRLVERINTRDKWLYGILISLLIGVVFALLRLYVFPGTGPV